jgi:hypothetical protein
VYEQLSIFSHLKCVSPPRHEFFISHSHSVFRIENKQTSIGQVGVGNAAAAAMSKFPQKKMSDNRRRLQFGPFSRA